MSENGKSLSKSNSVSVLFSLAFMSGKDAQFVGTIRALSSKMRILIDSGAYSNYTKRIKALNGEKVKPVTLEDYLDAISWLDGKVWGYITLDVIRDREATTRNLNAIVEAGYTPIPVLTFEHAIQEVRDLVKINPWVCVAGGADSRNRNINVRFRRVYQAADGEVKIHGLGYGRYPEILGTPIKSADSSSWCGGGQYGAISRFLPEKGVSTVSWKKLGKDSPLDPLERQGWISYLLDDIGVPAELLPKQQTYRTTRGVPAVTTVLAYLQYCNHLENLGKFFFLAVPNLGWFHILIAVLGAYTPGNGAFSYPLCLRLIEELKDASANDYERCLRLIGDILEEKTYAPA